MNLDSILADLADALELERELGVREVEIDREVLKAGGGVTTSVRQQAGASSPCCRTLVVEPDARLQTRDERETLPLVFLHDRALSPGGVEMMAKIVAAMKLAPETSPVLFTGDRPAARVTVVLGFKALRAWFPGAAGAPGQWITPDGIQNVLVTYSPEYILRFGTVTPAVKKLKLEMWTSLKGALQRIS